MLMVILTVLKSKLCWSSEQRIKTAHSYKQKLSDAVLLAREDAFLPVQWSKNFNLLLYKMLYGTKNRSYEEMNNVLENLEHS